MRGMHHALRGVVLLLACFASNLPPATARYQAKPPPEFCDQYEAVYKSIDQDLELYRNNGGITPELMARTMSLHTWVTRAVGMGGALASTVYGQPLAPAAACCCRWRQGQSDRGGVGEACERAGAGRGVGAGSVTGEHRRGGRRGELGAAPADAAHCRSTVLSCVSSAGVCVWEGGYAPKAT